MNRKLPSGFGPGAFRLFLAAVVVVHHTFPLRLGGWAVYVFFVLSGYWICFMWQKKYQRTRIPLLTFWVSRWWRLAPVFVTCTLLGVLSATLLQPTGNTPLVWQNAGWWLRQFFIAGSASAGRVLPPSWSLDVEMQFYLLAPLLVALSLLMPLKARWFAACAGVGYLLFYLRGGMAAEAPRLDLYLGCFMLGMCLQQSQWRPSLALAQASLAAFFGLTFLFLLLPATREGIWVHGEVGVSDHPFLAGWPHLWWALGALLVVPFVAYNVGQPSSPRDRWMGNLAYPLYLFHWIARDWYYKYVDWTQPLPRNLLLLTFSWAAAALGAVIILVFIDQPCDKMRARWATRRQLAPEPMAAETLAAPR